VCVCVCVCERERKKERERKRERGGEREESLLVRNFTQRIFPVCGKK
jgi:hypothetical protein